MRILLSRTDSIGDVVLTLPMAGMIKKHLPESEIHFLGRSYTSPVVACSGHVDHFHNFDDIEKMRDADAAEVIKSWGIDVWIHVFPVKKIARLVKQADVKTRIGTTGRLYHILTCNKLVRISRKRSDLHESQLNLKLLAPLGITENTRLDDMPSLISFNKVPELSERITSLLNPGKFNIILHPKSKGSAIEWGLENFSALMNKLEKDDFQVIVTGTEEDKKAIGSSLPLDNKNVVNLLGKLSLEELIALISFSDALVAASTGPLHLAGILDRLAIGLFSSRRPIHPGRWAPIGKYSHALENFDDCQNCAEGEGCYCISAISPMTVIRMIEAHRSRSA
ncbi:MAG TPA: glycosyl transferase family 9 [Flavobacteriales bacterium]|nr:glycosyl transferase family 9 [Flavobacteriales bacterium]